MRSLCFGFLLASLVFPASAGVFVFSDSSFLPPFIVVHPASYDGVAGGPLEVTICVGPDSETTRPALEQAVPIWNELIAITGNCQRCSLFEEEPVSPGEPHSISTVLLHELGHCSLGLGHVNWEDPVEGTTSFTNTKDALSFSVGADAIRGSFDDRPTPLPGSRLLHWFRPVDNNPFMASEVVDGSNYSRRIVDLPSGHDWPASGNHAVALALGHADTQSVMYSHVDEGQSYSGLTADDVNTVRFAMSGVDEMAGTSDDYTVSLRIVDDCAGADVEIAYKSFPPNDNTSLGSCLVDLEPLPTAGLEIHHVLKPFLGNPRALLEVNSNKRFDVIHASGFESGGTLDWTP